MGPGPAPEERGRVWDAGGRKKISKVLEKWPLASKSSPGGLEKSRPMKRLQRTQIGGDNKARKTGTEGRKQGLLQKWLDREIQSSEETPRTLRRKPGVEKNRNQQD